MRKCEELASAYCCILLSVVWEFQILDVFSCGMLQEEITVLVPLCHYSSKYVVFLIEY